jgi:Fe-S oxidoreductase
MRAVFSTGGVWSHNGGRIPEYRLMDAFLFEQALSRQACDILAKCTNCGDCARVCPMPGPAGLDTTQPQALTAGILTLLRGGMDEASSRWAEVCSGSGHCIPACQHGVNPRLMLALARVANLAGTPAVARRKTAFDRFGAMTKGVRVLSRLQLPPETLARFRDDADEPAPEVVFYTGCNVMKTPHIALLALDIMDAMGVRYRVMGGPSACCGVLQFGAGDIATSGRVATRTVDRLAAAAPRALSWCPTCQVQLSEIAAPAAGLDLAMTPFVRLLAERLDTLRPLMTHRVEKRVGLHEHPGNPGVPEAAQQILRAIPGLDFVDLAQPRVGYMCNKLTPLPPFKRDLHREQLQAAADAHVTTLAGIYHACHRELCAHERDWPFEVVNFLELVGESMGLRRPDLFKRLKIMQDVDAVLRDAAGLMAANGLELNEARDVILRDMLGEQPLALAGAPT